MNDPISVADLLLPLDRGAPGVAEPGPPAENKAKEAKPKESTSAKSPKPDPSPAQPPVGDRRPVFRIFGGAGSLLIVTTSAKEPGDRLLKKFAKGAKTLKENDQMFYRLEPGPGLALFRADERTFLMGMEKEIRRALKAGPTKKLPDSFGTALGLASQKYQVVLGLNGQEPVWNGWRDFLLFGGGSSSRPGRAFATANGMSLGIRFAKESRFTCQFYFPNAKAATAAEEIVEDLMFIVRFGLLGELVTRLDEQIQEADNMAEEVPTLTALLLLERMQKGLRKIQIKQQHGMLTLNASAQTDVAELGKLAAAEIKDLLKDPVFQTERLKKRSANNLKQIGIALLNYHDAHRSLPPAAKTANGKPLLSWRVLILPFIEQGPLYQQFKLDEPWDSPHNLKLLPLMPKIYAPVGVKTKEPYHTFYQAIVGPGAAWEKDGKGLRVSEFTDGTANTNLAAEAATPVPWTKPDDISFDEKKKMRPQFGGMFKDGFHALYADGRVRFIHQIEEATLQALITRNGGELVSPPDLR